MPEQKIQPAEDPNEEPAATDVDETDAPEPSLIKLPDGREVPPDKVVEALKTVEDKSNWERSLHEKGERLNEQLRNIENRGGDTDTLRKEFADLKAQIANAPSPDDDWEHEEDVDKRQEKFFRSMAHRFDRFETRVSKIEKSREQDIKTRQEREAMQYWDNVFINACNEFSISGNDKANNFIKSYVKGKMVDVGAANWQPDKLRQWAKDAYEYLGSVKKEGVNDWAKKKVKEKKTPSGGGGSPAPIAGQKIKGGMSLQEQIEAMKSDPNLE
jgi:hypothetical protein